MTNEELVSAIQSGNDVKNNMGVLYSQNITLIKKFIKPFIGLEEEEDLLQQAFFGLHEAVKNYDNSYNVKFMSYAQHWIKQSCRRHIENSGSVLRIPSDQYLRLWKYKKYISDFWKEYGRFPTEQEQIDFMESPLKEIDTLRSLSMGIASLDKPLEGEEVEELTLIDTLCSEENIEDSIVNEITYSAIWDIVREHTTERENEIIVEQYKHNKSLKEIAADKEISAERARQLRDKGFKKLRMARAARILKESCDLYSGMRYNGGMRSFRAKMQSNVEHEVLLRLEAQNDYMERIRRIRGH